MDKKFHHSEVDEVYLKMKKSKPLHKIKNVDKLDFIEIKLFCSLKVIIKMKKVSLIWKICDILC